MSGYLDNEVKTAEALRQHPEDLEASGVGGVRDGYQLRHWLHTGDQGFLDPDGYLCIAGRIKDIVIRGGENIFPMEIEARLLEHDAISQASIVGVPDQKYGEELCAFVELNTVCTKPSDEELRSFVRQNLARFKAPRYFLWIGDDTAVLREWPKTASGKISKPMLRDIAKQRHKS